MDFFVAVTSIVKLVPQDLPVTLVSPVLNCFRDFVAQINSLLVALHARPMTGENALAATLDINFWMVNAALTVYQQDVINVRF